MKMIKDMAYPNKTRGIADYFNLYKSVKEGVANGKLKSDKTIKIAVLSSFTIQGLKEVLFVKCCGLGILPEIYIGGYNQYAQEILDEESGLYRFRPEVIIVLIDTRSILGTDYLRPYKKSGKERKKWVKERFEELNSLISSIKRRVSAKIILHNFEVPVHSPYGILENKQNIGFIESIERLNFEVRDAFKNDSQTFIFNYDEFCSKIGKQKIMDPKMYYLGDIRLNLEHMPKLCDEYLAYIKPIKSLTKKCLVLDLDNTLWGGILGEDGKEGIKLGPTSEGRPFMEFQEYILSLFEKGVILAINSKNNPEDALDILRSHPDMILREEHFAAIEINWDDKVSNMKRIAEEINIGVDSLVFIDDDKSNREIMRSALPEVYVVELPDDPALYLQTIMELNEFNTLQITEEDKRKGQMYAKDRERKHLEKTSVDITEYLKKLEMNITFEKINNFNISRISQLTQKTNQFNMTTKRYTEEDIKRFADCEKFLAVSIRVQDKFGDNGTTGLAVIEKEKVLWRIDTFLLSCRIIGRRVEEALLAYICEQAKKENAIKIIGEFINTGKNAPAKDFYKDNGFKLTGKIENKEVWEFSVKKEYEYPDFIKVIK